jgi:hypothetical protein
MLEWEWALSQAAGKAWDGISGDRGQAFSAFSAAARSMAPS